MVGNAGLTSTTDAFVFLLIFIWFQTGFGWSNGVVLAFLEEFGWPQEREIDCANSL